VEACSAPNYVLYFEITWLPYYLVHERHFSMGTMAKIGTVGYLCYSAGAAVFGWISDRWIAAGGKNLRWFAKHLRGWEAGSAGLLLLGCALLWANGFGDSAASGVRCRRNVRVQYLGHHANNWPVQEWRGRWTGFPKFHRETLRAVIAPALTGFVVNFTGHFILAFCDYGRRRLAGCAFRIFFVIGPVERDRLVTMIPE